ncbi:MAG TPA: VOC family protein [Acidimicrobiia bacterium]|nr:VOC family protein [Acidimicrobiia bacterium]
MALDGARLFHVNANCSDLERSRRFYTDGLGLTVGAHTAPETAQPGAAFGLDRARWDASILLGPRAYEGGAIDLLQWHEPTPTGAPPARLNETGFQRLGLRVPDLDATIDRVRTYGGSVWSEPFAHTLDGGGQIRLVLVGDPDGTAIELIEGGPAAVSFVAITCADLDRARAFYRALGFREVARYPSENTDGTHLRIDGPVAMEEVVLAAPGGGDVLVMLVGFRTPPYAAAESRAANALGMWRAAFLVADLDAAVAELERERIETISAPVSMAMGPGLPTLRFVCFRGPDAEVLELIEQPSL